MKKIFVFLSFTLSLLTAKAADPITFALWDQTPAPCSNDIPLDKEDNSNPAWVTFVADPSVTIYPADKPNGTAMLMCPGGAYWGLAAIHEGSELAKDFNDKGITLAVLKYRMPNYGHHTVPADDARRALQILHEKAADYGINPEHIGIGGASAGGHLASTVATHRVDSLPYPAFQVLYYPVITMKEGVTHQGSRDNLIGKEPTDELIELYSNEKHVSATTPPAIILVSYDDDVVPVQNSMDYYDALIKNGVKSSLHIYPDGGHGWARRASFPYEQTSMDEILTWILDLYK